MINTTIPPCLAQKGNSKYLVKPSVPRAALILRRDSPVLIRHLHFNSRAFPREARPLSGCWLLYCRFRCPYHLFQTVEEEEKKTLCNGLGAVFLGWNNSIAKRQSISSGNKWQKLFAEAAGVRTVAGAPKRQGMLRWKWSWESASREEHFVQCCPVVVAKYVQGTACGWKGCSLAR